MSRPIALAVMLLTVVVYHAHPVTGCDTCGAKSEKPAILMPGLGAHHHPVSTRNEEAQRFFNQGLTLAYAFNHDESRRSFQRAAELDPQLAMAYWGIALTQGSNYNLEADEAQRKTAYEAMQKALALAPQASEVERAYIQALAKRYSADPKADVKQLARDYKSAMGELAKRYPDDLDAATLYAESAMNLRPWQLYSLDGKPAEGTEEIVSVLESILKRDPDHIGANHLYIHATEASLHPERAIPSANRLTRLTPAAGHLVHMPAHTYLRVGDYEAAAESNRVAVAVDRAYMESRGLGTYTMMYYSHNMHFLAAAHAMQGRFADARKAADELETHVGVFVKEMPPMEFFMPTPTFVMVRFRRWDDILKSPMPDAKLPTTRALWHFARGMAYAGTGKMESAEVERMLLVSTRQTVPADATWDQNSPSNVLQIAQHVLDAKIAAAKNDRNSAIEQLRKAVEIEDTLKYSEPAAWYIPVRESLGGLLFLEGNYAEAEKVFRTDLEKNPRNGRSLFGLTQCLKAQGNNYAAQLMQRQFETAWKNADTPLKVEDL